MLLVDEHALGALRPPPTPTLLLLPQPPPPLFVLLIATAATAESLLGVIVGRRKTERTQINMLGASINDIRKNFAFLTPFPILRIWN